MDLEPWTNPKVIGQAADCTNGADGSTRICQGPRTLDYDENGKISNQEELRPVRNG
ncbi:MAG: hypothetical protein WA941_04485 [Nitrososphaeraceae archaeon]